MSEKKEKTKPTVTKNIPVKINKPVSTKDVKKLVPGSYLLDCGEDGCDHLHPFTLIGINSYCACVKFYGEENEVYIKRKSFDTWKIHKNEFIDSIEF